jgi:hypothetical protein
MGESERWWENWIGMSTVLRNNVVFSNNWKRLQKSKIRQKKMTECMNWFFLETNWNVSLSNVILTVTIPFSTQLSLPDQAKISLHLFTIGFQKSGICRFLVQFLESNGKKVQWDFSLIINRDPHGTGLFVHPVYTFYSRSCESTYKPVLNERWDDLFSCLIPNRHGNWNPWDWSIYDQREIPLHYFYHWFQKSNGKKV